jgi:hypothetical protein
LDVYVKKKRISGFKCFQVIPARGHGKDKKKKKNESHPGPAAAAEPCCWTLAVIQNMCELPVETRFTVTFQNVLSHFVKRIKKINKIKKENVNTLHKMLLIRNYLETTNKTNSKEFFFFFVSGVTTFVIPPQKRK